MKRLLSILATLSVLAVSAPPFASAQYDTTSTDRTGTTGTTTQDNTTTGTYDDETMPNTAGPLPLIAVVGAILLFTGIRAGRRRTPA